MAPFFSGTTRHDFSDVLGEVLKSLVIVGLVLGGAGVLVLAWMGTSFRDFAIIAALPLAVLAAYASGNPRLFCLWGLMLTIPLSLSKRFGPMFLGKPGGEDSFRIEISDLFLASLAAFLIADIVSRRRQGIRIPKVTFLWILLIGIGCAWIVAGPSRVSAAHEVVRMVKVMLLFLVVTNELSRPGRIWHTAVALSVSAIGQAAVGIAQYLMRGLIGLSIFGETTSSTIDILGATSVQGANVFRPSGLLQHANLLGIYLAMIIPLAICMLVYSRKTLPRLFFAGAMAVSVVGMIVPLSRSAWLSSAVGVTLVMLFMLIHPRLRWRSVAVGGIAGAIGLLLLLPFASSITQRLLSSKSDATNAREIYKRDARRIIDSAPWVGRGLNSYSFEMANYATMQKRSYGPAPVAVHHIFYLWWAETGIVGMLLFCVTWGAIIWMGLTNLLRVGDELLFAVNAAAVAGIIALIPDAFLSFTLRVNTMLRVFWLLAGLIMAVRYLQQRETRTQVGLTENADAGVPAS